MLLDCMHSKVLKILSIIYKAGHYNYTLCSTLYRKFTSKKEL